MGTQHVLCFLKQISDERGEVLPSICDLLAAMVKYGVLNPVAACLVPFLDHNRALAMLVASICPYECDRPDRVIAWLRALGVDDLVDAGIGQDVAIRIVSTRDGIDNTRGLGSEKTMNTTVLVDAVAAGMSPFSEGERVLIKRCVEISPQSFELRTLSGALIGGYQMTKQPVPEWWDSIWSQTTIKSIEPREDGKLSVSLTTQSI